MSIKKLIPYDEYTLKTKLSFKEVMRRIENNAEPNRTLGDYFFKGTNKMFEGYVFESTFKLNRLINGRKSFFPIIEGHLYFKSEMTHVKIYAKTLYWRLLVFFVVWIFLFFTTIGFNKFFNQKVIDYFPLLVPLIVYLSTLFFFKYMNKKTKSFFIVLLEAE